MSEYRIINGELYHHGIKGQKWGRRRYQNTDGSWTPAGRKRYSEDSDGSDGKEKRSMKGNVHRALAKNYDLNSRVYKNSNKTMSSMNEAARDEQLALAKKADQAAAAKRAEKEARKENSKLSRAELEKKAGTFTASNGQKVAPSRNAYSRVMGRVAANRGVEKLSTNSYRDMMTKKHMDTTTNRLNAAKGERQIHKESQALREYNAHLKDLKKGTGTKYLDKEIRKNKIDDAYEAVKTDTKKIEAMFYSEGTRKKAAKYVVDNGMSVKDAKKKANKEALRNTAVILGVYGAMKVSDMYKK